MGHHNWQRYGKSGWLKCDKLTIGDGIRSSFVIGYYLQRNSHDPWTKRFKNFKEEEKNAIISSPAISGAMCLMKAAFPELIKCIGIEPKEAKIVPALSSTKAIASKNDVLLRLARTCAIEAGTDLEDKAITKKKYWPPLHHRTETKMGASERKEFLDEQAGYKSNYAIEAENIFIFDDFITTGSTLSRIAEAINKANGSFRANIYGVCLGQMVNPWQRIPNASNMDVPEKWGQTWDKDPEHW